MPEEPRGTWADDEGDDEPYEYPTFEDAVAMWRRGLDPADPFNVVDAFVTIEDVVTADGSVGENQTRIWIRSVRLIQEEGGFDDDTAAYLIDSIAQNAFEARHRAEFDELWDRWHEVRESCGLSLGQTFDDLAESPWEARAIDAEIEQRRLDLVCAILDDAGEGELALTMRADPGLHQARCLSAQQRTHASRRGHTDAGSDAWWQAARSRPCGLQHIVFFEIVGRMPERSPEADLATAGLLALRLLDHYILAGPAIVDPESVSVRSVRHAVMQIAATEPLRRAVLSFVNRMQRASRDGVERAIADLIPVAEAYRARGATNLAADVYWSIMRHGDDKLALVAFTALRAIEETMGVAFRLRSTTPV